MGNSNTSEDQILQLKSLSHQLSLQLAKVAVGARKIIKESYPGSLSRYPFNFNPAYFQLGHISFKWQLFIEKRTDKVIFVFRRKDKFDNSLKTEISFKLSPFQEIDPNSDTQELQYFWLPPPFIELDPPDELVRVIPGESDANKKDNLLWLVLGEDRQDLLAISFDRPKRLPKSMMYYFKDRQSNNVKIINAKQAPILWYEKIIFAILPWIEGKSGNPVPITLNHSDQQIQEILQTLSENFILAPTELVSKELTLANEQADISEILIPFYEVSEYEAKIILRLDVEEKVSTESLNLTDDELDMVPKGFADDLELFQLGVNLKGIWQEGRPVIRFNIFPPDFMTKGPLYEAFLETFLKEVKNNKTIVKDLDVDQDILENALTNPSKNSFIFRTGKRGERDTEMFILSIEENDKERLLMFIADFIVNPSDNKVIYKRHFRNQLIKHQDNSYELRRKGVVYFMRLLSQINQWKNRIV